jgi:hypothetical protein
MNALFVGMTKEVELPKSGFLIIDDHVRDIPRSRVFDPALHSLNPLKELTYKRAREIAEIVYTVFPQGADTLTVRNGKRTLLAELLNKWKAPRLDKLKNEEVGDLLMSPVLRKVLCHPTNFSFNPRSVIQARINRAELGDFDALVLGLVLMSYYKGQIIVSDLGFYGRDMHIGLIREQRLVAGVNFLGELPVKLRNNALLIREKIASEATYDDAVTLAQFDCRFPPRTEGYDAFIEEAMN